MTVIGDFNLIGEVADKMGGNQHISKSIDELQNFISNANLLEVPFKGVKYTWTNNRDEAHHARERIDRALVNADWMELHPQSVLTHGPIIGSDHTPLILKTKFQPLVKRKFRFETMWSRSEQCENVIRSNWQYDEHAKSSDLLLANLKLCSSGLSKWSKKCFGNNRVVIKYLSNQLQILQNQPPSEINRHRQQKLLEQLDELWIREEMFWHQRARVNWINFGDSNSQFFHITASHHKQRNKVVKLRNNEGKWISSELELKSHVK